MNFTYKEALKLATKMHKGQKRKYSGEDYISHPITVADQFKDVNYKIVAVLHDTIEDTKLTLDDLNDLGLSGDLIYAIKVLTHESHQSYLDYIISIQSVPMARNIKRMDIKHNLSDLKNGCLKDKYLMAYHILQEPERCGHCGELE